MWLGNRASIFLSKLHPKNLPICFHNQRFPSVDTQAINPRIDLSFQGIFAEGINGHEWKGKAKAE